MRPLTRRALLSGLAVLLAARPIPAAMSRYRLIARGSSVGFSYTLSGLRQSGTIPVKSARIDIDPGNLARSRAEVLLDVTRAKLGFGPARAAMLGPLVLDAAHHPTIRFVSTGIRLGPGGRLSDGAEVTGDLTLRGVTQEITLTAALYRERGTPPDNLRRLNLSLHGYLDRTAFGASGFRDLVADLVEIRIRAEIARAA